MTTTEQERERDVVYKQAARELRNYANVLNNLGCATDEYIARLISLATRLDGNQPDARFTRRVSHSRIG
ncbi:hypothetical protein [Agrobacterium pusense]|uniref:hypothetical protein n=1 Tax=Agrobacterium pusense TaxID=648995 RepID=UPI000D1BE48E|nr:hypothetical protein [Agrobacterium pusense]